MTGARQPYLYDGVVPYSLDRADLSASNDSLRSRALLHRVPLELDSEAECANL